MLKLLVKEPNCSATVILIVIVTSASEMISIKYGKRSSRVDVSPKFRATVARLFIEFTRNCEVQK